MMGSATKKRKTISEEMDGGDKEDIIASSVAQLMESDRKCVSFQWQKGTTKKQKAPKVKTISVQNNNPTKQKNGLQHWKRAESIFSLNGFTSWNDFGLHSRICSSISFPTPIDLQKQAIPAILDGHDIIIGSGPHSGKTLSYVFAILHNLTVHEPKLTRRDGTQVVVLCKDLTQCQANYELWNSVLKSTCWWLTCSVFAGGENRNHEKARLRKGVSIMITTESRLMDHLENTTSLKIDGVKFFVIEEVGELLRLKRGGKLRRANQLLQERVRVANCPRIQNIVTSSTLHDEMSFLAHCMLRNPVSIGFNFKQGSNKKWFIEIQPGSNIQMENSME
eukprot:g6156.t1